ncbi:MAG: RluA family pseudouridine synthase [Oscillospiraceae bacterium]|nr:RluA family pseudouridine synthase [Oscillospiraceae bacterium]
MNKTRLTADICDEGKRLDVFVAEKLEITRNAAAALIEGGGVSALKKNYKLRNGDVVEVEIPEPKAIDVVAQNIPLDIVYEDEDLLVINKARGMVVHPAAGNWDGTLVNALMYHCGAELSGINGVLRPGIVHRLDKDTSGLMLVAKNDLAHNSLAEQIKEHTVRREYHTVVIGNLRDDTGTISAPIGRHRTDRKKMTVTEMNSKEAVTHYTVLERYPGFTYASCVLETGRTHQIRVHMSHTGHPVVGDAVYGARDKLGLEGQCLHSKNVTFIHPRTNEKMHFESDLPGYFEEILRKLRARQGF